MSDLIGRKVKYMKLHNPIFIPKVGNLKDTILNEDSASGKGVDMTVDSLGVVLVTKDEAQKPITVLVPNAAISHAVLIPT